MRQNLVNFGVSIRVKEQVTGSTDLPHFSRRSVVQIRYEISSIDELIVAQSIFSGRDSRVYSHVHWERLSVLGIAEKMSQERAVPADAQELALEGASSSPRWRM